MHVVPALPSPVPPPPRRGLALRGAAAALGWLGGSVAATFPTMQVATDAAARAGIEVGPLLFAAVLAVWGGAGGALWGRTLAVALARRPLARRMAAGGALGFGAALPLAMTALTRSETALLLRVQAGHAVSMALAFMALFPAVTAGVVLAASLALAAAAGLGPRAWRVAGGAAAAAGSTFLLVAAAMHAAGWRVGAPGAEARLTMLVVAGLGLVAATVVAGALVPRALARELGAATAPSRAAAAGVTIAADPTAALDDAPAGRPPAPAPCPPTPAA